MLFPQNWEAGALASSKDSSIPVSWRSAGPDEGRGRFPWVNLHALHMLSLFSLRSLLHTSCVYFLVRLIPSSPRACLHTAAEGSSQTTEEIAVLACLSYLISTLKFFPSFNPCGLDSLKVSRKPHPLVPPKTSHPEVQGLISLEHHAGK